MYFLRKITVTNLAKGDNKTYPGEMLHVDTKRLPLLKNETK
ncbi:MULTISPECIES: hypothetical protein [unclassified Gilliamella]|nr:MULTISPECIES: hypothetical protein [unclassified Gilliamella]